MYGPDEHRSALRRIGDVAREVEGQRDYLASLRVDLMDDAPGETQTARDQLRTASQLLGKALAALDNAATDLPTPQARPDYGAAFRALHGDAILPPFTPSE